MRKKAISIAFINNKGGVGKTTTNVAPACLPASLGKKALLPDCDPQGNTSMIFGRYRETENTLYDLFTIPTPRITKENVRKCIYPTANPNIDIIPSNEDDDAICTDVENDRSRLVQLILKKALATVRDEYGYILMDNSPFYSLIAINSLCSADYFLVPVCADGFSYAGLANLLKRVNKVKGELNEGLQFLGAFFTKYDARTEDARGLFENYVSEIDDAFIPVYIRQDQKAVKCATHFASPDKYCPGTNFYTDYKKLLAELPVLDAERQKQIRGEAIRIYESELHEISLAAGQPTYKGVNRAVKEFIRKVDEKNISRLTAANNI